MGSHAMHHNGSHDERSARHPGAGAYARFAVMIALSFAAMYVFMYAMVDELPHAVPNLNTAYMAGLMTAPMVILEMVLMRSMYPRKALNAALVGVGTIALVLLWSAIRGQAGIGDREFLRSMIPHHSGAILMCSRASIADPEIRKLCGGIVEGQKREIRQMEQILARMSG